MCFGLIKTIENIDGIYTILIYLHLIKRFFFLNEKSMRIITPKVVNIALLH